MSSSFNIDSIKEKVREFVKGYPQVDSLLDKAAEKTKVDKEYVAIGGALIPVLLIIVLGFGKILIDLVGFAYPVYASIKAIETNDLKDDSQWLTYWIIFGFFKIIEGVADVILQVIPLYFPLKVLFLLWCYHPNTIGAKYIYTNVIKPFVVPAIMSEDSKKEK